MTTPTTLLLLDPTSVDGESALELLTAVDDHVAIITMLRGRTSSALREFAHAEDVDLVTAGWIYLDQVVARLELAPEAVQTVLIDGSDFARDLSDMTADTVVRRVIVPASIERWYPAACAKLRSVIDAPVLVAAVPTSVG
jgi:hypothetical protein